jgi:hypothetical protein
MRKAAKQATKHELTNVEIEKASNAETDTGAQLMQAVLAKPRKPRPTESTDDNKLTGIVIGMLSGSAEDGRPMVHYPGIPGDKPLAAISTENAGLHEKGHEVALGFVDGNPALPIILGLIQKPEALEQAAPAENPEEQNVNVQIDGETLTLSADREIVLKCGKSSITLTRAGKVILKGAYVSTHSTGMNRIKGGAVQIN